MTNSDATEPCGCAMCGAPLKKRTGRGRPPKFCSTACKRTAELKMRRLNEHIARLELEAERCRRTHLPLYDTLGASPEQRAQDIARELGAYEKQLRELFAAMAGDEGQG
jgi:hypothetical protein